MDTRQVMDRLNHDDENENRRKAWDYVADALKYRGRDDREKEIKYSLLALETVAKVKNLRPGDRREISRLCHNLGDRYFNCGSYKEAAQYYAEGANQLYKIECQDEDYRKLVKLYIDLADAFSELFDTNAAYNALMNAKIAFNFIHCKSSEERAIGNPDSNIEQFYKYYEKLCSTTHYLKSTAFKNNQHFLMKMHEGNILVNELGSTLSYLTTNEQVPSIGKQLAEKSEGDELGELLGHLGMKEMNPFLQIPLQDQPEDEEYRQIALQLLEHINTHFTAGMEGAMLDTCKQAKAAFERIREKSSQDEVYIQMLQKQIDLQKKKARTSVMGLLAQQPQQLPQECEREEFVSRMEM